MGNNILKKIDDETARLLPARERGTERSHIVLLTAHIVSLIYSPFYLPVVAFIVLFLFSYLNLLPVFTKLRLIFYVYLLTVLAPRYTIGVYRKMKGWTRHQLGRRERRLVPYIFSIACYCMMLYLLIVIHMPRFTVAIIVGGLVLQLICAVVNNFIKISTHAAASAAVVGALMAFSLLFSFNPIGWLCLAVLLCGMVCTARLILRQHSLRDIGWGVAVGLPVGFLSVVLV